jgi:Kef-type K+ transport system membrane component KefB
MIEFLFLIFSITGLLLITKAIGELAKYLGQPAVIGQLLAGFLCGPSVLGYILPQVYGHLSQPRTISSLGLAGHLAVALYLFFIGLHSDPKHFWSAPRRAVIIALGSIAVPFIAAVISSKHLIHLAPENVSPISFGLFCGVAFSITAFPVLVQIMRSRGILHLPMGQLGLAVAAINDLSAWIILAIASMTHMGFSAGASKSLFGLSLFTCFFGGFLLSGNRWSQHARGHRVEKWLEEWGIPLFFASAGLKVHFETLQNGQAWSTLAVVMLLAIGGKVIGTFSASRIMRVPTRPALALGVLMNTRGLVELVALELGLRLGILSTELYALFMIMAVVTTVMTSPCLRLFKRKVFEDFT